MDMAHHFRTLTHTDLDELVQNFPQPQPDAHVKRLAHQDTGDYSYFCIEQDGTIAAIQLVRWTGPRKHEDRRLSQRPEIGSLYVRPEYRGKGLGSALIAHSEDTVYKQGHTGVGAIIKDSNAISIQMHVKRGYQPIGIASRTDQDPDEPRTYYVKRFTRTDS
jgi:GNAT superfamily N-acetyltransferase